MGFKVNAQLFAQRRTARWTRHDCLVPGQDLKQAGADLQSAVGIIDSAQSYSSALDNVVSIQSRNSRT